MKGENRMQRSSPSGLSVTRRHFVLGVAGGALGVLAAACAPAAPPAAAPTAAGRAIHESFPRHNPRTLAVEPALATKWEYTKPTEIVWTLRDNVTFHDGKPFGAEDAKWNIDRMIDPATANPFAIWYEAIEKNEVVNKNTLRTTLKR